MAFDPTVATDPRAGTDGDMLAISWTTTAPAGTLFQVYLDRRLAWHGAATSCRLPWPGGPVLVDVGAVGPAEGVTDFSSSLPASASPRVRLAWPGGTYLSPTLAGFRVYAATAPGGAIDYSGPVATVAAHGDGGPLDGYGLGGYGGGGYGRSASAYAWTSGPLAPGVWSFAVAPFDDAGNVPSGHVTASATIAGPPRPPAASASGRRLSAVVNPSTRVATLSWLPSPA